MCTDSDIGWHAEWIPPSYHALSFWRLDVTEVVCWHTSLTFWHILKFLSACKSPVHRQSLKLSGVELGKYLIGSIDWLSIAVNPSIWIWIELYFHINGYDIYNQWSILHFGRVLVLICTQLTCRCYVHRSGRVKTPLRNQSRGGTILSSCLKSDSGRN